MLPVYGFKVLVLRKVSICGKKLVTLEPSVNNRDWITPNYSPACWRLQLSVQALDSKGRGLSIPLMD